MTGIVYRCYSATGELLYIGHTIGPVTTRIQSHRAKYRCGNGAQWFADFHRVEVDHYPTWQQAHAAETALIAALRPAGNKHGNPDWRAAS